MRYIATRSPTDGYAVKDTETGEIVQDGLIRPRDAQEAAETWNAGYKAPVEPAPLYDTSHDDEPLLPDPWGEDDEEDDLD